jgi:antitoxin (DNA-binding transcriptional repressor) of toxin-antitoxin stability system
MTRCRSCGFSHINRAIRMTALELWCLFRGAYVETVGIRELKTHLSRHLKRVRSGASLLVTERGRSIATISPVEAPADLSWASQLVAEGRAHWNGGKPTGAKYPVRLSGKRSASSVVLEDRR